MLMQRIQFKLSIMNYVQHLFAYLHAG